MYGAVGCFIGTISSIFLNQYKTQPFVLFFIPIWGLFLGIAVARVVDKKLPVENKETLKK